MNLQACLFFWRFVLLRCRGYSDCRVSAHYQTHGLPCPSALGTWKSKVEQRAVDMMCHVYEHNGRLD